MSYKPTNPFNHNDAGCTTKIYFNNTNTLRGCVLRELTVSVLTADNITLVFNKGVAGCMTMGPYFLGANGGLERIFGDYGPWIAPSGNIYATKGNATTNCTISGSISE